MPVLELHFVRRTCVDGPLENARLISAHVHHELLRSSIADALADAVDWGFTKTGMLVRRWGLLVSEASHA